MTGLIWFLLYLFVGVISLMLIIAYFVVRRDYPTVHDIKEGIWVVLMLAWPYWLGMLILIYIDKGFRWIFEKFESWLNEKSK